MKKRIVGFILCLFIALGLTGCNILTPDNEELLYPPQLTGDMYPIEQALKESVDGEYTLKYPSYGEQRSAVMLEDINNDGEEEAFAFYSTSDDDLTTMHINAIVRDGEGWKSVAVQSVIAAGLEKVEFSDLNGDGTKEIVVGWEIYAKSEKQLSVYSLQKSKLKPLLVQNYTSFVCCDLDQNQKNELFIHLLDTTASLNNASLYSLENSKVVQIAGCIMDKGVNDAKRPILSQLSNGEPAIYIDEIKGVAAVTEVLYIKGGQLTNSLLDTTTTMENTITVRPAAILLKDIDGDAVPEIPIASPLPNADSQNVEKLYYINWCSFDGTKLLQKDIHIINSADGYSLDIPQKWVGNIAVQKDTESRIRTVYSYDNENDTIGDKIVTFKSVAQTEWDKSSYDKKGFVELLREAGIVYSFSLTSYDGELKVSEQTVIDMFALVGQNK